MQITLAEAWGLAPTKLNHKEAGLKEWKLKARVELRPANPLKILIPVSYRNDDVKFWEAWSVLPR